MKTLATFALALALHLTLGWAWTLGAGLAGGVWAGRRGWLVGAAGVAGGWAALVAYNFAVVLATVLIGAALGALGGFLGQQLRCLLWTAERRRPTADSRT